MRIPETYKPIVVAAMMALSAYILLPWNHTAANILIGMSMFFIGVSTGIMLADKEVKKQWGAIFKGRKQL